MSSHTSLYKYLVIRRDLVYDYIFGYVIGKCGLGYDIFGKTLHIQSRVTTFRPLVLANLF